MIDKIIKKSKTPLLIAEISANHMGKLSVAKKLIYTAKKYGADFVKLQTYTPETITINSNNKDFRIKSGIWKGETLWSLYQKAHTPFSWHKHLFKYAKKIGITCFSTPFDETALSLLENLNCPFYKVASYELTHIPLIKEIAQTKKTMIISTGMASIREISDAFNTAKKYGNGKIILLYCVSNYPSNIFDFNLNNIEILKKKFSCEIGLSDHSNDFIISEIATSMGVKIIEKHIALENQKKGIDINFSLRGKEIKKFKERLNLIWKLKGNNIFFRANSEKKGKLYRRSIYVVKDIPKGFKITPENIKIIRPSKGLDPKFYKKIIGKKSVKNLKFGQPFKLSYIK